MRAFLVLLFLFALAVAQSTTVSPTQLNLRVAVNATIMIQRGGNPATAYDWVVTLDNPSLASVATSYGIADSSFSDITGLPYVYNITFTGLRPGSTNATLRYKRPWEALARITEILPLTVDAPTTRVTLPPRTTTAPTAANATRATNTTAAQTTTTLAPTTAANTTATPTTAASATTPTPTTTTVAPTTATPTATPTTTVAPTTAAPTTPAPTVPHIRHIEINQQFSYVQNVAASSDLSWTVSVRDPLVACAKIASSTGSTTTFTFTGLSAGMTEVLLEYRPVWGDAHVTNVLSDTLTIVVDGSVASGGDDTPNVPLSDKPPALRTLSRVSRTQ